MKYLCPALIALLLLLCSGLHAQIEEDEFHYGFYAGATYNKITDIETTIIRPIFDPDTYTTSHNYRLGGTAGFFIFHRFRRSSLAIQPELSYAMYGGDFNYSDVEDLEYTISFNYQYINLAAILKIYPAAGLFVGIGPQVGVNIANSNLKYTSNMPELGPDLQIEQALQEVLKGTTDFSIMLALGYELEMGLSFEARYKLGLADVIETLSNGFNFIENDNYSRGFQFTVGYAIPFY